MVGEGPGRRIPPEGIRIQLTPHESREFLALLERLDPKPVNHQHFEWHDVRQPMSEVEKTLWLAGVPPCRTCPEPGMCFQGGGCLKRSGRRTRLRNYIALRSGGLQKNVTESAVVHALGPPPRPEPWEPIL